MLSNGAGQVHASLWSGTPESWVDLHPAGAKESIVYGMFGEYQVGYAVFDAVAEAGIWKGTAQSWVSLSDSQTFGSYQSQAFTVSSDGISLFVGGFPYLWSRPLCLGDFNRTGVSDVPDILDFLNAWFAGDPRANFNGSGPTFNRLSVQDIFDFLNAWFAGC